MSTERISKQVIVMRKDLNMRKGKMVAQGSHASLGAVLMIQKAGRGEWGYRDSVHAAFKDWIEGTFTKVCVGVEDEATLLDVYEAALALELPVKLITDSGRTEFHGHPTNTCLAIGPAWSDEIDRVTGDLKLL